MIKKLLSVMLILCTAALCGCEMKKREEVSSAAVVTSEIGETTQTVTKKEKAEKSYLRAMWYSYIDLDFYGCDEAEFSSRIDKMFNTALSLGLNAVICQVRSNSDAIYPSEYFPFNKSYTGNEGVSPGYDPLGIMVETAHKKGLEFHAWVNPYRVSAVHKDVKQLSSLSPARKWLEDGDPYNDGNICYTKTGMYYNPSSEQVRKLCLDGIREILDNYDVDGIQFDDYFYPTTAASFDKESYEKYRSATVTPLPLDEWRRTNVSILVSDVYSLVHRYKGKVFGISPAAAISDDRSDDNYKKLYADIYLWASEKGYVDYIAPQLYFGFEYPLKNFRFDNILKSWCNLKRADGIALYVGLAPYKNGTVDANSHEWEKHSDIVAREINLLKSTENVDGFMLYSYNYVIKDTEQFDNIKKELANDETGNK